jgi:hypothetical protein
MTDEASLRGDCTRCIGLCCVALAFDRGPHFGFDKPAGTPCRHLGGDHACAIHAHLERDGFLGCASYDCRGAGQLVTQMFAGLSWRDSPAVARQMFWAFAKLREIQTMRSISPAVRRQLEPPDPRWTLEALHALDLVALRQELAARLASPARAPMLECRGPRGGR